MTVWDEAQKLDSAKGSVWDAALALEQRPHTQEDPNEAYQTAKDIMDLSVEFGLPLNDIEKNYQEISSIESGVFDPSEPPLIQQPFEYSPEQPFDIKIDKVRAQAAIKVREQKVKSITQFLAIEGDKFSEKQKLSFLPDADLQYAADVIMTNPEVFDRKLHKGAQRELRVREFIGALKSAPEAKQIQMIVSVRQTNLFNVPRFFSKNTKVFDILTLLAGGDPSERVFGGERGDLDAAIEAATRVLAEKNEIDPINTARIVDLGAGVMKTAIEFWLTPGAQLANAPKAIRPMLEASAKFAAHAAIQAPAEGETLLQRAGSVTESGLLGLGIGAAGKFIPKTAVRVPVVVGGFAGLTYARTGDIEASIETGVTVLGFEALGLMQKATRYTSIKLRNTFADKAVRAARAHNPDLFGFSNKEVGQILQKQMENWQQVGMERVIGDKSTRQEADNALRLKRQGDPTAWNALMKKHGFGQAVTGKPPATPTEAPKAPGKPAAALPAPTTPTAPPTAAKPAKPTITAPKPAVPTAKPAPPPDVTPKQVAEVAEKLPEAVISQKPVIEDGKKFYPVTLPTEKIGVDAKKFQFKLGAKLAGGVSEALKGVEKFSPVKGGQILIWQDKAGKYWVVDGHHRVALAKKTGAENLATWVIREADGWTAADARAQGALRNLADGKGTAIDAAKLFRDSKITLDRLRKEAIPTNNIIVQQGMDMKDLSDYVFRLVVDEKLPPSYAAVIGKQVVGDTQQKQVADLILEGEIDTVRQAELLAATIDTAPVLTTSEQTLFGLETTEKSLYAERAKVLASVERKLKTNKKVFGTLATQTGIIEAKGNILKKVENLAAKEQAEEVLFMLEKLANAKGPTAEALNDATKEYAKNPTKENLAKVTTRLLEQWTQGPGRLRIPDSTGVQPLPLERAGQKAVGEPPEDLPVSPRPLVNPKATALEQDAQRKAQQAWDKKHPGGKVDITPLADAHNLFMSIIEPSKAVEIAQGKDVYAEVIKAVHKADVAMIDFNEKELENLDMTLGEWGKALSKYSNRTLELLMLSRGKPASKSAILIRDEALEELAKKAPELVGTRKMITRASDFNYDYLAEVVGGQINYIEDYFYGIYKDPRKVEKFLDHWKTTKRFTKEKKLPTVADAKAFGLDLRDPNPVNNLRSEYLAIARLEGMIDLKTSLMKSGEGDYIAATADAPIEWDKVHDPVFADVRVAPELAKMINNLISTNKITRIPALNTLRQTNNFLRTIKFIGSAFHLAVEAKQSLADSGYLGFLHKRTATRGLTTGFKQGDPIFKTPEYKDYIAHGGGHRFSIDSEAQRTFSAAIEKMGKAGGIAKGVALPFALPEKFVRWMFENYIPKVKYSKYLDTAREQEVKLKRSLTSAEKIDIIKEQQNFYGMMNERLFGRSGTVTTLLRMKFMAPGFAEGNFRSMLKAVLQWGGNEGFSAHRSRANIINSFIISAIAATVGTIILTGKPPKKPEKLSDIRDIFKIDTGQVDQHGRPIMIDMLTYDKDYWDVFGNLATLQPAEAAEATVRRLGGMTATTWDVLSDLNQMSMGRAVYDWKGDRVVEVTDPFLLRILKISIHELKKAEPISTNVFQQARKKGVGVALSAAMTLGGVRLTKTEQDKKEVEILHKIFSLRDQQETLFWYLGTIKNPREHIKKYNQTVMRILDNPITPLEVKDEYEPKLIIDEKRLVSNKVYDFLGDKARLAEAMRSPKKRQKDIKELQDDIQRTGQWLRNFEVTEQQYRSQIITYEELHRKITKEIQPEDDRDALKKDLARFYADQTILKRKIQSGLGTDTDRRLARKYVVIGNNIAEVARRIYDTEDEEKRDSLFGRIETVIKRIKE